MLKKFLATLALVGITVTSFGTANAAQNFPNGIMWDVDKNHSLIKSMTKLTNAAVMTVYKDGSFHSEEAVSRKKAARYIYNTLYKTGFTNVVSAKTAANMPKIAPFPDVPVSDFYSFYIGEIKDAGIINGYQNGMYGLNNNLSRGEVLAILLKARSIIDPSFRLNNYKSNPNAIVSTHRFTDVNLDNTFYNYIYTALDNDYIAKNPIFRTNDRVTKAEIAGLINSILYTPAVKIMQEKDSSNDIDGQDNGNTEDNSSNEEVSSGDNTNTGGRPAGVMYYRGDKVDLMAEVVPVEGNKLVLVVDTTDISPDIPYVNDSVINATVDGERLNVSKVVILKVEENQAIYGIYTDEFDSSKQIEVSHNDRYASIYGSTKVETNTNPEEETENPTEEGNNGSENTGSEDSSSTETETETPTSTNGSVVLKSLDDSVARVNIPVNVARATVMSFEIEAKDKDITLDTAKLRFSGLGDSTKISQLALYSDDIKVTRGDRKFLSDNTADLYFERNITIKKGEKKKVMLSAMIDQSAASFNQTYSVELTELKTTNEDKVTGVPVKSPTLTPIFTSNVAAGKVTASKITQKITIGEETKFADFAIEETSDKEDLVVKSITFEVDGVDETELENLALYASGKKIEATFVYGSSSITAKMDHTVTKDKKVDFELKGSVSTGITDTVEVNFENNSIYAVGKNSNIVINMDIDDKELAVRQIDGSEINIAFNRSQADEVKPDTDDFALGEIVMKSASPYVIKELELKIVNTKSGSTTKIEEILKEIELDGNTADTETDLNTTSATLVFKDIYLSGNKEKKLPLTASILKGTSLNGITLKFTPKVLKVKDEDNGETYDSASELSTVLSSNAFTAKNLKIETASFEMIAVNLIDNDIVLYNGIKTPLHKMKAFVGDSSDVVIDDMEFVPATSNQITDFTTLIDKATLTIGGKTFDGTVESGKIKINNINHTIKAGENNVEIALNASLKDDSTADGKKLVVKFDSIDIEDVDSNSLAAANLKVSAANSYETVINIQPSGSIAASVTNSTDGIEENVLAGTSKVNLAEVKMRAKLENASIDSMIFNITTNSTKDLSDTLTNVKLVSGNTTLVSGGRVKTDASNNTTTIEFKNFVLPKTSTTQDYMLVADVTPFSIDASATVVALGTIRVSGASIVAEGDTSNTKYTSATFTGNGVDIKISPLKVTYKTTDKFDSGNSASILFTITEGKNSLNDDDINVTKIKLRSNLSSANVKTLTITDDNNNIVYEYNSANDADTNEIVFATPVKVNSSDEFEFRTTKLDTDEKISLTIDEDGVMFKSVDTDVNNATNTEFNSDVNRLEL